MFPLTHFVESFNHKWRLNFVNRFFYIIEMITWFLFFNLFNVVPVGWWVGLEVITVPSSASSVRSKWTAASRVLSQGTSLVVQWLRICLPMQGTWVWALVREDPTCCGATRPVSHNYWACALEPVSHNYWACALEPVHHNYWGCAPEPASHKSWSLGAYSLCSTTGEATAVRSLCTAVKSSPCSPQLEKARAQQQRPNAAKNK